MLFSYEFKFVNSLDLWKMFYSILPHWLYSFRSSIKPLTVRLFLSLLMKIGVTLLCCLALVPNSAAVEDSLVKFRAELIIQPNFERTYFLDNGLQRDNTRFFFRRIRPRFFYTPSERWSFFLQLGLSPGDRDMGLESYDEQLFLPRMVFDLMGTYKVSEMVELTIGQTKLPFSRQRPTPFANIFMFDRSIVNSDYGHDFDVGIFGNINLQSTGLPVLMSGALTTGQGRNIRINSFQPALTFRADFFPLAYFSEEDYRSEMDWEKLSEWRLRLGAAYHHNPNLRRGGGQTGDMLFDDGIDRQLSAMAFDLIAKYSGFTLMFDFVSRRANDLLSFDPNPANMDVKFIREGIGAMGQVNYAIDQQWAGGVEFGVSRPAADLRNGNFDHAIMLPTVREFSLVAYYRLNDPQINFQGGFTIVRMDYAHSLPAEEFLQLRLQATIRID